MDHVHLVAVANGIDHDSHIVPALEVALPHLLLGDAIFLPNVVI